MANKALKSIKFPGLNDTYTIPQVDNTLAVSGAAADAKKTGDAIGDLKSKANTLFDAQAYTMPLYEWSQGGINGNTGATQSVPNRVRALNYFNYTANDIGVLVVCPAGYKVGIREYSATDGVREHYLGQVPRDQTFVSGQYFFKPTVGNYYRYVLAYTDDSNITPSDVPSGLEIRTIINASDAVRDASEAVTESIESEFNEKLERSFAVNALQTGGISDSTGGPTTTETRIRGQGYLTFNTSKITVSIASGYKYAFRVFSAPGITSAEMKGSFIGSLPSTDYSEGTQTYDVDPNSYYRIVVAKTDDSNISPSDAASANITIVCVDEKITDSPQYSVANGTLLGNVSVRAAKTWNFSDGTPPVIEWYLLQDTNNCYYRSKDLASKEFLFQFFAPSGYPSNWSCGIDANNNVFFIKDASGYTDDDGPRLDDGKRVNPVYYLANEKYAIQHTLDFGASLKPAGWISNVGWCVLPNNDIIMCEYTRGTLATCNVWHVSGADTTDPDNWTVTWSHAIVDSTSASDPDMKHCHDVQHDFYTGIDYFGTGDGSNGSYIYYSTDNGVTWTLAYGPNRALCRQLNYVFTKDHVYWASDNYEAEEHNFYIANRLQNGVIDIANATAVPIGLVNNQACYGCSFIEELNFILFVDRNDTGSYTTFILQGYDLDNDEIVTVGEWQMINGQRGGFRCKFVDWYPKGSSVLFGFNPRPDSVTPDTNVNALCGNQGGINGSGITRINNLELHIIKKHDGTFAYRATTLYC